MSNTWAFVPPHVWLPLLSWLLTMFMQRVFYKTRLPALPHVRTIVWRRVNQWSSKVMLLGTTIGNFCECVSVCVCGGGISTLCWANSLCAQSKTRSLFSSLQITLPCPALVLPSALMLITAMVASQRHLLVPTVHCSSSKNVQGFMQVAPYEMAQTLEV